MNLLTIDEIAAMFKLSRNYVRDKLVKRPAFPRPSISLSQKARRWDRNAVESWAARCHADLSR